MSTPAIQYLKKAKVPFEVAQYKHDEKGAAFASQAIGFPLESTIKTLVVRLSDGGHVLALMPGDKQLDLKRLAKACAAKRAEMADPDTAQRLTGYLVGGISPFGVKKRLPAVMEEGIERFDTIAINGGRRGTMLIMKTRDLVKTLGCEPHPLAVEETPPA